MKGNEQRQVVAFCSPEMLTDQFAVLLFPREPNEDAQRQVSAEL
jgi:hypothetical protein